MNPILLLASAILLQPILDDATEVRLAASATGDADVNWYVDGDRVAVTPSGNATTVLLDAGMHDVWATTGYEGSWRAVLRPVAESNLGSVAYVDGWSGVHQELHRQQVPWPFGLAAAGLALIIVGARRPKRP